MELTYNRIFWFLFLSTLVSFVPLALFLPETCRQIVDDASIPPPWTCGNFSDSIRFRNRRRNGLLVDEEKKSILRRNIRYSIPNPMAIMKIVADFETALLLFTLSLGKPMFANPY